MPPLPSSSPLDRRAFVGTTAAYFIASALAAACGGEATAPQAPAAPGGTTPGGGTSPGGQAGVTISGTAVAVNVAQANIGTAGQFVILQAADAIVINVGTAGFVALSKTCTHSGCGLSGFNNGTGFLECNCHGSRFRTTGQVAVGPANAPLRSYPVTVDGGVVRFTV